MKNYCRMLAIPIMLVLSGGVLADRADRFNVVDSSEPLEYGRLLLNFPSGWVKAPYHDPPLMRPNVRTYLRADAPTVRIDLETQWKRGIENETGRRHAQFLPREYGDFVKAWLTWWMSPAGNSFNDVVVETGDFADHPGFKLTMEYTNPVGLDMKMVSVGAEEGDYLYWVTFHADTITNFDKYLGEFERIVKTAKLRKMDCTFGIYLCN